MWSTRMKADPALAAELDRARLARDWQGAFNTVKKLSKYTTDPLLELLVKGEQQYEQARASDKKDYESARATFEKAVEKSNDPEGSVFLGLILAATGNDSAALNVLRPLSWPDANSLSPWEARVALLGTEARGTLFMKSLDPAAALQSFNLFVDIGQKVTKSLPLDDAIRSAAERTYSSTASIYFNHKNNNKALDTYRQAVRSPLLGSEQRARVMRSHLHFLTYHVSRADWTPFGACDDLYVPSSHIEEALLLARLLEEMHRKGYGWKDAGAVLPLANHCVILFSLWAQAHQAIVVELEKALAFPLQPSSPLWFQYGLALINTGRHWRGLVALQEHLAEHKQDAIAHLIAARVCINNLANIDDGLRHALAAALIAGPLQARAREAEGVCYLLQAIKPSQSSAERKRLLSRSIETLHTAFSLDPNDHAIVLHLALAYTHARETSKALHFVGVSLELRREHAHSWLLFALLLSTKKDYERAITVCRTGTQLFPDELRLLYLKARIESASGNNEAALRTLLAAFKTLRSRKEQEEGAGSESAYSVSRSQRMDDGPSVPSVGRSSTRASTMSDGNVSERGDEKSPPAGKALCDLWLQASRLFLGINQLDEAMQCLSEARPLSADESPAEALCIEGMITERTGNTRSARDLYQRAIVFNPNHVPSLCHLGDLQLRNEELLLAETTLSNAILVDPLCHDAWKHLGTVYKLRERFDQASDCLLTALELEENAPVLSPSEVLPIVLY